MCSSAASFIEVEEVDRASKERARVLAAKDWADLREDNMIHPAPDFWPMLGPLGGPGSPGNGPGSKNSAGCTKNQPRRPNLSPIRGQIVFLGPTAKIQKYK